MQQSRLASSGVMIDNSTYCNKSHLQLVWYLILYIHSTVNARVGLLKRSLNQAGSGPFQWQITGQEFKGTETYSRAMTPAWYSTEDQHVCSIPPPQYLYCIKKQKQNNNNNNETPLQYCLCLSHSVVMQLYTVEQYRAEDYAVIA